MSLVLEDLIPCRACNQPVDNHQEGKCLFGPGVYTPRPRETLTQDDIYKLHIRISRLRMDQTPWVWELYTELQTLCKHPQCRDVNLFNGNVGWECVHCGART